MTWALLLLLLVGCGPRDQVPPKFNKLSAEQLDKVLDCGTGSLLAERFSTVCYSRIGNAVITRLIFEVGTDGKVREYSVETAIPPSGAQRIEVVVVPGHLTSWQPVAGEVRVLESPPH